MMNLVKVSDAVFVSPDSISVIGREHIDFLRESVVGSPRGRVRINMHPDNDACVHEMFIAISPESYIRPHKHIDKTESFHVVYGEVDVVAFTDDGEISSVTVLGRRSGSFYCRMSTQSYHTLVIHSDLLIVHEVTCGPFDVSKTVFGEFSPEDMAEASAILRWKIALEGRVANYIENLKVGPCG